MKAAGAVSCFKRSRNACTAASGFSAAAKNVSACDPVAQVEDHVLPRASSLDTSSMLRLPLSMTAYPSRPSEPTSTQARFSKLSRNLHRDAVLGGERDDCRAIWRVTESGRANRDDARYPFVLTGASEADQRLFDLRQLGVADSAMPADVVADPEALSFDTLLLVATVLERTDDPLNVLLPMSIAQICLGAWGVVAAAMDTMRTIDGIAT